MRFRERPDSWYDSPDEPTDAEYDACRDAWAEALDDHCDTCRWMPADEDDADGNTPVLPTEPCNACRTDPPARYDNEWQQRWFEDRRYDRYD